MKFVISLLKHLNWKKAYKTVSSEYIRPTWDEYFIEVANAISKRATCDRGRSGCVIARDKMILVTGYVGSPAGLPHCDEVGHLFKKQFTKTAMLPSTAEELFMQNRMQSARLQKKASL